MKEDKELFWPWALSLHIFDHTSGESHILQMQPGHNHYFKSRKEAEWVGHFIIADLLNTKKPTRYLPGTIGDKLGQEIIDCLISVRDFKRITPTYPENGRALVQSVEVCTESSFYTVEIFTCMAGYKFDFLEYLLQKSPNCQILMEASYVGDIITHYRAFCNQIANWRRMIENNTK